MLLAHIIDPMHIREGTLLLVITQGSRLIEAQRFREGHRANHILALKASAQTGPFYFGSHIFGQYISKPKFKWVAKCDWSQNMSINSL